MISKEEFNVLYYLIKNPTTTNQQIAEAIGVSLREARDIMSLLKNQTYIGEDGRTVSYTHLTLPTNSLV
mgnify:CR=1 FL=1